MKSIEQETTIVKLGTRPSVFVTNTTADGGKWELISLTHRSICRNFVHCSYKRYMYQPQTVAFEVRAEYLHKYRMALRTGGEPTETDPGRLRSRGAQNEGGPVGKHQRGQGGELHVGPNGN